MHSLTLTLVAVLACASSPLPNRGILPPPQAPDVAGSLVDAAWRVRRDAIGDAVSIDRRALYVLFGRASSYERSLSTAVRESLTGDTIAYEKQPARPAAIRLWTVRSASVDASGRATVVAELHYQERQHSETYTLVRGLVAGKDGWIVTDVRISNFIYY